MTEGSTGAAGSDIPDHIHDKAAEFLGRTQRHEPGAEAELAAWLEKSARHRIAYDMIAGAWDDASELSSARWPDAALRRQPFYRRHAAQVGIATAAAVLLAGTLSVWMLGKAGVSPFIQTAQAATYETRLGEIRTFRLSDGTRLTLDTDTKVGAGVRGALMELELVRGRIRVETGARPAAFLVNTKSSVQIDGTSFDASRTAAGVRVVALREGVTITRVSGEIPEQAKASGVIDALPVGVQADVAQTLRIVRLPPPDVGWVTGMVTLESSPLEDAIAAINRYNEAKIILASPQFAKRPVSGAFRATDPSAFAAVVARLFGLRVDRQGHTIVLRDR